MSWRRVKLAFVTRMAKRKAAYRRRKKSLFKKLHELTTLCGVDACAVMYSEFESDAEVWPSKDEAQHMIARFEAMPVAIQKRNMFDLESLLKKMIAKTEEKIQKLSKENRKKEMTIILAQWLDGSLDLDDLSLKDLKDLKGLVDERTEKLNLQEAQEAE